MEQQYNKDINQECLSFALRRCSRAITQIYDHALADSGIRSTQFNLLMAMARQQSKTLTDLAMSLVMDRTTLTRNLKPLEKSGLICSVATKDKRSKAYSLTMLGRSFLDKALPLWKLTQERLDTAFGPNFRQQFIHSLNNLIDKSRDLN